MADNKEKLKADLADIKATIDSELVPEAVKKDLRGTHDELEKKIKALEMAEERGGEKVKKEAKKEIKKVEKKIDKKPAEKKEEEKAAEKKKDGKKAESVDSFELTIDGETVKFTDLASKEACERAIEAVKGRYKEVKEHKKATAEGKKRAKTVPVTQKVTDGLITATKRAVAAIPKDDIKKHPDEVKKALDEVEKAFNSLFDKLENLLGSKIPATQRQSIFGILTRTEEKIEKQESKKDSSKKEAAVEKKKESKQEGGLADGSSSGDSWSYTNFID